MEEVKDIIKIASDMVSKTDQINKRLITAVIIAVICFSVTIISVCAIYFLSDYDYGISQTQINGGEMINETK